MPTTRSPRKGSMQYWPRRRAKRPYPRIRSNNKIDDAKPLAFAGYKVGMIHTIITDNRATSMTKGMELCWPMTVIECPSLKTFSLRFYKKTHYGLRAVSDVLSDNLDKELKRKTILAKKIKSLEEMKKDYDEIRLIVYTQPKLTSIGKKKPEIFEIKLGGDKEAQLNYAKNILGKEININDIFKEGEFVDVHAITKGKGTQGPVKRFGIGLKSHKSEKGRRRPGNLGPWTGAKMWRVAQAGKTGYYQRTEHNKMLLKIGTNLEEINPEGGFKHYGLVKNTYILLKGSVPGPAKRPILLNFAVRNNRKGSETPEIKYMSSMKN